MKEYSVSEVVSFTETLEKQLLDLLSKSSPKLTRSYKRFINRCNSLFVVFCQFEMQTTAFSILHKALSIDLKAYFNPINLRKSWKGRILLYLNTGFFMIVVQDFASSLKFLYDAESLIVECQASSPLTRDLILAHSFISALAYFRNRKYEQAEKHVEAVVDEFNQIIRGDRTSRYTKVACCNIYCLTTLFLDVLKAKNSFLASSTDCKVAAKKMKKFGVASVILLDEFNLNPSFETGNLILVSDKFRKIMAATVLFPFIDKGTPIVLGSELREAQERGQDNRVVRSQLAGFLRKSYKSIECKDFYALLMMESIQNRL